jgi:hypothetical protein
MDPKELSQVHADLKDALGPLGYKILGKVEHWPDRTLVILQRPPWPRKETKRDE